MIKFVVVEDEPLVQENMKNILRKISIKNNKDLEITYYKKYNEKLQEEIDSQVYRKIYIMDIELEGEMSGLDIAEKIREKDWDSEIIFVTCHDKMFETAHRRYLEVFDFIEKFQDMEQRLTDCIERIFQKKLDNKMLKIKSQHANLEIYFKNILYITRDKEERKTVIHADEELEFRVNYPLSELLKMLDDRFIQTHKSCIANKNRITEKNYGKGYFILDNGEKVGLLSKRYRSEIEK